MLKCEKFRFSFRFLFVLREKQIGQNKKGLSPAQHENLIKTRKGQFEINMKPHKDLDLPLIQINEPSMLQQENHVHLIK